MSPVGLFIPYGYSLLQVQAVGRTGMTVNQGDVHGIKPRPVGIP
jgi:hypothetical protein